MNSGQFHAALTCMLNCKSVSNLLPGVRRRQGELPGLGLNCSLLFAVYCLTVYFCL